MTAVVSVVSYSTMNARLFGLQIGLPGRSWCKPGHSRASVVIVILWERGQLEGRAAFVCRQTWKLVGLMTSVTDHGFDPDKHPDASWRSKSRLVTATIERFNTLKQGARFW